MEPRISLVTLGVDDLQRSLEFYRDGLGLPTTWSAERGVIFFQTSGTVLALYPREKLAEDVGPGFSPERVSFSGITIAHNVREKSEVDRILQQARSAGARIEKPAQATFWEEQFEPILDASVDWMSDLIERRRIEAFYTRVLWPTGVLGYRVQERTGVGCAASVDDRVFVEQLLDGPDLLPPSVRARWAEQMSRACERLGCLVLLARHLEPEIARLAAEPARVEIIPSGFEPRRFDGIEPTDWRSRFGWPGPCVVLICAARLDPPKRQDLLVEGVARLSRQGLDLRLVLLGAGSSEVDLRNLAARRGVADRVRFLGYQPNAAVPAALLGADVVCAPTDWEAFPIQLLEGLASGKPMIVSAAPPYDDVLADQDLIRLCENDIDSWTEAAREAVGGLSDPIRARRRRTLTARLLRDYTQEATSRRIESVLADLCSAKSAT